MCVGKRKTKDIVAEDYYKILDYLRNPGNPELKKEAGRKKWDIKYYLRNDVRLLSLRRRSFAHLDNSLLGK